VFGEVGWVTAVIVASMPLAMLQIPGRILLERSLSFRPLAAVELSQVLAYNLFAIGLVAIGFGVWGIAVATILMRIVALVVMARVSPVGVMRPRFSGRRVQPLLGFGIRFQATNATWIVGQQGFNMLLAAIGGLWTLGMWSLASRVIESSTLLTEAFSRVSFPAMSQLEAAQEPNRGPFLERAAGMAVVGLGVLLTGLAGSAPGLFAGVFGEQWGAASEILPAACLGLAIGAPVSVVAQGYLYAVGEVAVVLRYAIIQAAVLAAVTLPLVPVLGLYAIGIGMLVSSCVGAQVLRRAVRRRAHADIVRPLFVPVALGVVAAAAGWLVSDLGGATLASAICGGVCAVLGYLLLLTLFRKALMLDTFRFALGSVRAAFRPSLSQGT
jgi:O-antigen/teichoic acid export membrane protein